MGSMTRHLGAMLLGAALAVGSVSALDFEKVDSWIDDGFDLTAEVFFSDESTLWAFRNEYAIRMMRGQKTPLAMWALSGINMYDEPPTGPVESDGFRNQTCLQYFDPVGQRLVVHLYDNGDGVILFRLLDLKTAVWTPGLSRSGGDCFYGDYDVRTVKESYGIDVPQGQSFITTDVSSFDKTTGMADVELRRYDNLEAFDSDRYRVFRTIRVDTSAMGELAGVLAHTPIERILWTDGSQFVFISYSNCFMGYLRLEDGVRDYKITVIPGTFWLKPSYKTVDTRGVQYFKFMGLIAKPACFGCVKTWGHRFLLLDASPVKQLVTDIESLGKLFKLASTGTAWLDRDDNESMLDTILRKDWSKIYSGDWSGTKYHPLDPTISMPYRIAAYDPRTNTVTDTGLPYFYTVGMHPLSVSPKGNLIAFAEKDPKTGKFVSYSIYRVILDAEVNDERVRYRSAPSTKGTVLGMFSKGERVKVLDRSDAKMKIDSLEDYWYLVRRSDGSEVWMYGAYLLIVD